MDREALIQEFYDWELRGRGWDAWPYRVTLEPPFRPFIGHGLTIRTPPVDDGQVPSLAHRIGQRLGLLVGAADEPTPDVELTELEALDAEAADVQEFVSFRLRSPEGVVVPRETLDRFLLAATYPHHLVAFDVVAEGGEISFSFSCPARVSDHFESILAVYVPELVAEKCDCLKAGWDEAEGLGFVIEFGLSEEFLLPLGSNHDPVLFPALLAALSRLDSTECGVFQVLLQPVAKPWSPSILQIAGDGTGGCFFSDAPEILNGAKVKTRSPLYATVVRIGVRSLNGKRAASVLRGIGGGLFQLGTPSGNAFMPLDFSGEHAEWHEADLLERTTHRSGMILSGEEVSGLLAFPDDSVATEKLARVDARTKAIGERVPGELVLGTNVHRGVTREVTLSAEERSRHLHVIGASGTGKTVFLESLITQDIKAGRGCAVLDPHGDLVDSLTGRIPNERIDETIVFDPSDLEHPVGFNILEAKGAIEAQVLESDLVGIFRRFATSWGDQMTAVLGNAVGAILSSPRGGSILELRELLRNKEFRSEYLSSVTDDEVRQFWALEFPKLSGRPESSILSRLNAFLRPKPIRNVVGQTEQTLDLEDIVSAGKILLVRLPVGLIGEENAHLLGSLLVAKIHQVALMRQRVDVADRPPFHLFVDEFHHFATPSIASILEGARKYGLGLVLAHQSLHQVRNEEAVHAALANAHTRVAFRLGDDDSRRLEGGFASFSRTDLEDLGMGRAIARIGEARSDFTLQTEMLPESDQEQRLHVLQRSAQNFGGDPLEQGASTVQSDGPPDDPPHVPEVPRVPAEKKPRAKPTPGRGGPEHKYIQQLTKRLAEERGWRAVIEEHLPDGGRVDVALSQGTERIAIEISVTTDPSHELGNVRKCLEAGFPRVVLVGRDEATAARLRKAIERDWADAPVEVVTPGELSSVIPATTQESIGSTVRGYRVRVSHKAGANSPDEALARIVAESVRRRTKDRK